MTDTTLTGGCACGAVRYTSTAAPVLTAHCHCRDCKRASGAAYATVCAVPRAAFRVDQGETRSYRSIGDSGHGVVRHFCPTCGAPLFSDVEVAPDLSFLRVVSLDDPAVVTPTAHVYCASAQPWDTHPDGLPAFPRMPG